MSSYDILLHRVHQCNEVWYVTKCYQDTMQVHLWISLTKWLVDSKCSIFFL